MTGDGAQVGGLPGAEAAARLARYGPNEIGTERRHRVRALAGRLSGPVPWMLEAAIVLEIAAGKAAEAVIIALLVVFNAVLSFVQEDRTQGALALLRQRLQVRARVCRDGRWQVTDARQLVPGDLVHVRLGDVVPADLTVTEGTVRADQSVLTGESAEAVAGPGGRLFAGSLVRRGEVTGTVTATGTATYYGRTAELVRTAQTVSHLEQTIFRVVWALLAMDGALVVAIGAYGIVTDLPLSELLPFVLILVVASVPVALPATFTLATALGAAELARAGVLVTRLSAIEEAAAMDLLCTDKTGTITANKLTVTAVRPYGGADVSQVLALAAAASDDATQDPIDLAVLAAARSTGVAAPAARLSFTPFDPAVKRSEAVISHDGAPVRVVKGAPQTVAALAGGSSEASGDVAAMAAGGARVLAVASGEAASGAGARDRPRLGLAGLIVLADPPRPDSAALIARLAALGIRVIMVTGDTAATAVAVARQVGIGTRTGKAGTLREPSGAGVSHPGTEAGLDFDVLAGVLPEDKLRLVERAQRAGHVTGMTGDGVNDAPALRRAEVGIAVAAATDVAKSAASVVLTDPGLGNIVAAVETGRQVYQRMLTYTINKIVKTFQVALFLGLGLLVTRQFVTTPRLVLLLLFANDFVTMALATDNVSYSPRPDRWRVPALSLAALAIAVPWLAVSFATFYVGRDVLGLGLAATQTLVFVMLAATGQATVYLVRERRHLWRSRPSSWMLTATAADLTAVVILASRGILMAPVPPGYIAVLLGAVGVATLLLDAVKAPLLRRLAIR
ncbi:MAG TPA: plasma-membrane proton-efflux P-type ATPase [Trebonia sp.]|nr:plasma-membrane proton-efflux P-type ATPase [Trebonia sp.]